MTSTRADRDDRDGGAAVQSTAPDQRRALEEYSFRLYSQLSGAVTAGMIHLGDRLGLYRALADADGALTAGELAAAAELHERWVREWAANQAAAELVEMDVDADGVERFALTSAGVAVCVDDQHPAFGMGMFHQLPQLLAALDSMPECFATGIGLDYDSRGAQGAAGMERSFIPWLRHNLIPTVLPELDGVLDRLAAGIDVIDIGCGAGAAMMLLADAFPNSRFTGYEISRHALDLAEQRRQERGLTNVSFRDPRAEPISTGHDVGLVLTIDCVHDMAQPTPVIEAIRQAIADDGTWLLVDIRAGDSIAANIEANPMAAMLYGVSVLVCMSSALSEPDGEGLGTLGLSAARAAEMTRAAGFTRFRELPVQHKLNAFYEIRP